MIPSLSRDTIRGLYTTLSGQVEDCAIFISECYFHAVEAPVEVEEVKGIDPMTLFVLRAFEFASTTDVEHLDGILHIGRQIIRQMLNGMAADELVFAEAESTYRLTGQGLDTLQTGQVISRIHARQIFRFLHPAMVYVTVRDPKGNLLSELSPSRVPSPWEFSPEELRHNISKSADWKRLHGFPVNVTGLITEQHSPKARELIDPTVGIASDSSSPSQGQENPSQSLIVDKAQVVTCVLVVRQGDAAAVNLSAYPISAGGNLLRYTGLPLFSLSDGIDVGRVFPGLSEPPTVQEVTNGWLNLAAELMLSEAEQAEVRFENNSLVIALSAEQLGRWVNFVTIVLRNQLYWQVPQAKMLRLCKVAVAGTDSLTSTRLQVFRSVLGLEQNAQRVAIVRSVDTLRGWLATEGAPHDLSSRELADITFRLERYRLAYEISELEDMTDATVNR